MYDIVNKHRIHKFLGSGTLLWHNGDEYIMYKCIDISEDGTCDQVVIDIALKYSSPSNF